MTATMTVQYNETNGHYLISDGCGNHSTFHRNGVKRVGRFDLAIEVARGLILVRYPREPRTAWTTRSN